jgi:hypothetical protein
MPRSLQDIIDSADELADAFEAWDPTPDQERTPTPEMLLRRAAFKRAEAERQIAEAVAAARAADVSWRVIGESIGTTAQSAQRRYRIVVPDTSAKGYGRAVKKVTGTSGTVKHRADGRFVRGTKSTKHTSRAAGTDGRAKDRRK